MTYNGSEYFYLTNLQGDVTGLGDAAGATVVSYSYDSWGKLISTTGSLATTLGVKNPYRYRGYRYDTETGLYYLQSRYYNPEIGRFINADAPEMMAFQPEVIHSSNLFLYCFNSQPNLSDAEGRIVLVDDLAFWGLAISVVAIVAICTPIISSHQFQSSLKDAIGELSDGISSLWSRFTLVFQSAKSVVTKAVEKNIAKATNIINRNRLKEAYWIATKVVFSRKNVRVSTYFPAMKITLATAISYVRSGGDVFANSRKAAQKLGYLVGMGNTPLGPEIHGGIGYFWHYHSYNHRGGHIFFI